MAQIPSETFSAARQARTASLSQNQNSLDSKVSVSKKSSKNEILEPIKIIRKAAEQAIVQKKRQLEIGPGSSGKLPMVNVTGVTSGVAKEKGEKSEKNKEEPMLNSIGSSELLRTKFIKTLEVLSENQKEMQLEMQTSAELKKLVRSLEDQLANSSIQALSNENENLKSKNTDLKQKLETALKQLSVLNIQKNDQLSHSTQNLMKQQERLQSKLNETEIVLTRLQKQYADLQGKYSTSVEQLEHTTESNSELLREQKEILEKNNQYREQAKLLEETRNRVTDLEFKLKQSENTNNSQLLQIKELESQIKQQENNKQVDRPSEMKSASKEDFMALYSEAQKEKDRLKLQILRMENQTKNDTMKWEQQMKSTIAKHDNAIKEKDSLIQELTLENSKLKDFFANQQAMGTARDKTKSSEFGPFMDLKRENLELREKIALLNNVENDKK